MSRPVIPPSRPVGQSPTTQALTLLQKRLTTAEAETVSLVQQLAGLGFPADDKRPRADEKRQMPEPVAPFLPTTADPEVLHRHYEALVARLCRTESQLQTLKLNLCALQAERGLARDQAAMGEAHDERLGQLKAAHEDEVWKLNKDIAKARKECREALDGRNEAEEEARRLDLALEAATSSKTELAVAYEELMSSRQKMSKRNAELREELAREGSLRMSLEESHAALLDRICEMEGVVESERQEVQKLSDDCSELRQEGGRVLEEKRHHVAQLTRQKELVKMAQDKLGAKEMELAEVHGENAVLLTRLNGINCENVELRNQMQDFRATAETTEKRTQEFEEERKALNCALTQVWLSHGSPGHTKKTVPGSLVAWVTQSLRKLEAQRTRLNLQLTDEQGRREAAEHLSSELQKSLHDASDQYQEEARQNKIDVRSLEETIEGLKRELSAFQSGRRDVLQAKEDLLQEVNVAVDGMSEKTGKLHQELTQAKLEVASLGQDKQYLTEENSTLMERIASLEQQQNAQQKVQSTIAELLESKNRLAYDKGHLQSRLDRLQEEVESLAGARTENQQLQKVHAAVQAQCVKTTSELSSAKVTIQRLERKLRQEQQLSDRKEQDFSLAIQARDEATQEGQRLRGQLEVMVDREKKKAASFQRSLGDAKNDQAKIGATLEGVMMSHQQLQTAVENLQTELGRKDNELSTLRTERHNNKKAVGILQREVEKLTANLVTMETAESSQLDSLRYDLDQALAEKSKLATNIDDLLQTNGKLQATAERLQNQLEKRNHKYKLLQEARERDKASLEDKLRASEESLQSLRQQLVVKRDASIKNASKELSQQQRANEDLTTRVKNLTQTNAELRDKIASLEEASGRQRDRIRSLKSQLESSARLRKTNSEMTEKIKDISRQLSQMESAKREYARKNSEQTKTISNFVGRVSGLQSDLMAISSTQTSLSSSSRKKEHQMERKCDQLQEKTKDLQEMMSRLREEKKEAQDKLFEASNESVQISASLQEAHSWFKARHDGLQQELAKARQRQTHLEKSNTDQQQQLLQERTKAAEQTQRARDMIRASRHALTRLARQAEADSQMTRSQMTTLAHRLQAEKDHSTLTDNKLQKFMDISGQYIEELAMELDQHRSRHEEVTT